MRPSAPSSRVPPLPRPRLPALRWPLPALLAWVAAWVAMTGLQHAGGLGAPLAAGAGLAVAGAGALAAGSFWRRIIVAGGFPLSLAVGGAAALPGWAWLVPLAVLALAYPVTAWRDAPVFPTPRGALAGLEAHVALPAGARVLDAGCGLGHGLRALRAAFPQARLEGVEWSWPLALAARLRCPWARVVRGDMWRDGAWSGCRLVYLFQRPESMARAFAKAEAEMDAGAWLASLEFEVAGRRPHAVLRPAAGRPVWLYRIGAGR
jgi:hypothetical protein